ncbi:gamma-glutamylcyclotransferase [Blastochloris tepida]|jgi:cation transport protein ChaC|uniref:glutathione-specific gamma-glutamylcyclotransferase n=1 Tax=Blastochloris tepida TaxID=2233851 RepID=A0A348G5D1_9HYPH|nr:gamma-glutamylcyclotransferase [Blastochloris tepida]BBF94764.1 gamma-glutamylcyclotransferase [Blastochloris tepida]
MAKAPVYDAAVNACAADPSNADPAPQIDVSGHWVFGYGSLMWRPDFAFVERHPARLIGAHRALCLYSHVHRGTPERPGLVLGLDLGGQCRGVAYRVEDGVWPQTLAYLREREQTTKAYREVHRRVRLASHPAREVLALVYVIDRAHPQYAGNLTREEQLHLVRQGHGRSGPNRDYVLATVAELERLGIRDDGLSWLAERLWSSADKA